MFVGTLYIRFATLFEQNKVIGQGKAVDANFWRAPTLADGASKLEKNSAYRQVVEDGLRANEEHNKLTDPVEAHDWMHGTLERSQNHINSKLNGGLRSEEHTSELQSLMRISYAVFCLKKKNKQILPII